MNNTNHTIQILDGAMGTLLQQQGLELGHLPELLCLEQPERIIAIHRAYAQAGATLVYANTFGANRFKLKDTGYTVAEVVAAAVDCARAGCAGTTARVAVSVGATGRMMEPAGTMTFEEAYDVFRELSEAAQDAGADCIVFETMMDLCELRAAVLAAKESVKLPVYATMTFEENGRTFTGCDVRAMALVLEGLGVDALGVNCSLAPQVMLPVVRMLAETTALPLIVKLNAGLPDPETGVYSLSPEEYVQQLQPYLELGVAFFGGCCGTTPEHIRALSAAYGGRAVQARTVRKATRLCSSRQVVALDRVRVIGERINPTGKKRFQQALRENDLDYILAQAVAQADAGADLLDVNVGMPQIDEAEMMRKVVNGLQSTVDLPLQIDSSDPAAIESGLRHFCGKAIINSVNGEPEVLARILPLAKKYGAAVLGLCMDKQGIPATAEARVAVARRILQAALQAGLPREDVLIDCLTLTVSAQPEQAKETLTALRRVKEELGLHTVLGVSNISFGLPNREQINSTFLSLAMANGLDLPILNPNSQATMGAVRAATLLFGQDPGAERFVAVYGGEENKPAAAPSNAPLSMEDIVRKGLKKEAKAAARALLEREAPMDVVQNYLIPALDQVGALFEKGVLFLPQLMNAAETAQSAFEVVKASVAAAGGVSQEKGRLLVATVQGDIHDIGKNITKCILENYGYQVLDLGRDVPVETVAETAKREKIRLVGLSALMTTTLPSMGKTIAALRQCNPDCKIFVAGAVLTPEYAAELGADFYAKDAKQAADIAKAVLEDCR